MTTTLARLKAVPQKLYKSGWFILIRMVAPFSPYRATQVGLAFYKRAGMTVIGSPNYISSKIWFDGTDYSMITLQDGCTISSYVRVLVHDWSATTTLRALGYQPPKPVGRISAVTVGEYAFVGTGCVLMPGSSIGRGAIVAAGTVVRGKVPDFAIVQGSPMQVVGDAREHLKKNFPAEWARVARRDQDGLTESQP